MKIYKTIFRLDYPLAYKILDNLGGYLEFIRKRTSQKPFSNGIGNINLLQHSLRHSGKVGDDPFTLNLDLKTFNAVLEINNGQEIGNLSKNPLFKLADDLIEYIEIEHSSNYERIGVRNYILIKDEKIKFNELNDYIWNCNKAFGYPLSQFFNQKQDIAVVFEAKSANDENIRIQLGPYKNEERPKYFSLNNEIEEGMILDIDIWQINVSLPKLKLETLVHRHEKIYNEVVKQIKQKILEM